MAEPTDPVSVTDQPADGSALHARARRPSLLRRQFSAQESGLVLVIAVMVAALSILAPVKERSEQAPIPPGSKVVQTDAGVTVTSDGDETTYRARDGWTLHRQSNTYPSGTVTSVTEQGLRVERPGRSAILLQGNWSANTGADGTVEVTRQRISRTWSINTFLNTDNLIAVATGSSFYAIMAIGAVGVIVMAGIDLSIGSIYAIAAVVGAVVMRKLGADAPGILAVPLLIVLCCGVGSVCGLLNGVGTVALRVHPFIITLGTMAIFRGVAYLITGGESLTGFPESIKSGFIRASIFGIQPVPLVLMVVVGIGGAIMFTRTVFGRRVFALGGSETAAKYAGISVGRTKIIMFMLAGALGGLSAAMLLGYYGAADSNAGFGYELRVIAAAVVGGASLSGGRGSAIGAVLGAIIIQLIENAIIVLNIPNSWTQIIIGLTIVLAVVIDQTKHRLSSARGS